MTEVVYEVPASAVAIYAHPDDPEVSCGGTLARWAASNPHYFPDAGPPHQVTEMFLSGTLEPDTWVDVTASIDAKAEGLLCHQSQVGESDEWLRTVVRQRAEEGGRQAGVRYAEGFR